MNICIFSANYLPNIGGVERYTYYLAKELIQMGNTVTVVTNNVVNARETEVSPEGIFVYRFPCYNLLSGRYPVHKKNKAFKAIDKELSKKQFDFVIVNARFYLHSLYGAKFAKKHNIPVITIEHGSSHLSVNNKVFDFLGGIFEHFVTAVLKGYCKDYYGVSQAACTWSGHFNIKSKGVLFNAIELSEITSLTENPVCSYRKEYNIPDDALIITYTGRLVKEKGSLELAKAFNEAKLKNAYLFIAGDGEMMDSINQLKKENDKIILLGRIDFSHVVALLKESQIFCLPTVYPEGLPTSVLEAAAAKCFIITTRFGGAKEFILDQNYGILLDGNSVDELVPAIKKAVIEDEYRNKAIEKSYLRLQDAFVWNKTAQKVIEIIKEGK